MPARRGARRPGKRRWLGALAGLVSAAVLFAVAELAAAFFGPGSSPLVSVGAAFIDFTPPWLKDFAISVFGTADKTVLFISMALVTAALAALAGMLAVRRFAAGASLVAALAVVMGVCVATRAVNSILDLVPTALGTLAGLLTLSWLTGKAVEAGAGAPEAEAGAGAPEAEAGAVVAEDGSAATAEARSRRSFLVAAGLTAAAAVVVGLAGRTFSAARNTARMARQALKLPAAKTPAKPLPAGTAAPVPGMPPYVTPNPDFYRIDTALVVPEIDPAGWSLRVHGLVEEEFTLSFDELLALDLEESYVTLTCVSNVVGGDLAGNAKWLGYPVRKLLERARPQAGADMVLSSSVDGFTASTPLAVLQDRRDALLAVGMNGEPLPLEHGYPVRMVVPGLYGYVSATKWVVDLEVTRFADKTAYWTTRGWSERGPIKTASRIDVPRAFDRVSAGTVAVGGTAWAQHRGISRVQVQFDGGGWQDADLAAVPSIDTWRQWSYRWEDAPAGRHEVRVRAYDTAGELQTQDEAPPAPDGATGWHSITFTVE
ncbi:molybdopterin-dependent oxidoreductase [Arthrobacter sp. USHLN218]|uniref:molybdopterin-dependent oxidoreductase n=1 Tax=Arthrobacter sp. USHLN218 TaxID=3081232 RepID=UPI003015FBA2